MKIVGVLISIVAIALITGAIGFTIGSQSAQEEIANLKGEIEKTKYDLEESQIMNVAAKNVLNDSVSREDYQDTIDQYNQLVDKYNALAGSRYYSPINCTSNAIGSYTYTNCY